MKKQEHQSVIRVSYFDKTLVLEKSFSKNAAAIP